MKGEGPDRDFFQAGGTLGGDAPSYIERPADEELRACLERREYCLIIAPRQTGKSSLMTHAAAALKRRAIERGTDDRSAYVDLQGSGSETNPERWYAARLYQIERGLKLRTDSAAWWTSHAGLGPSDRFAAFLRDVVLDEVRGNVTIFVDEIETVFNLPFSDDFFLTIRSLYNERATSPEPIGRLTFVLAGLVPASELIQNRSRTPFNVGTAITPGDFDRQRTSSFERVLGHGSGAVVDRIFYWTTGQPFFVQRLAKAAHGWDERDRVPERIDREVVDSFLQVKIEKDAHFKYIGNFLSDGSPGPRKVLRTYLRVLQASDDASALGARARQRVSCREDSAVHERLMLAGIVREEGGFLVPRNRIYATLFDKQWARDNRPVNVPMIVGLASGTVAVVVSMLLALSAYTRAQERQAVNTALDLGGVFERHTDEVKLAFRRTEPFGPGLKQLVWLGSVDAIDFADTHLDDDDLKTLGRLDGFRWFNARFLKPIGLGLPGLRGLTGLKKLGLRGTLVTEEGLEVLSTFAGLETLDLGRLDVSDRGLGPVGALAYLRTLDLTGTKITADGLERLTGLTRLESLGLGQTKLEDLRPKALAKLKGLKRLYLTGTALTDDDLRSLKEDSRVLESLKALDLGGTKVTGPGLAALNQSDQLQMLGLGASQVDELGLAQIRKIRRLEELIVAGVDFPEEVSPQISDLPKGLHLLVLSGDRPLSFSNGLPSFANADGPLPLASFRGGAAPLTFGFHPSILNAVVRRWLRVQKTESVDHYVITALEIKDGPLEFELSRDSSFEHFLKLAEATPNSDPSQFTALRLKKSDRDPDFITDSKGQLNVLAHDLSFEIPAPSAASRGGLLGNPAKVISFDAPAAKFTLTWKIEPATSASEVRLTGRIVGFDPGTGARVKTIANRENDATPLNSFSSNLLFAAIRTKLQGQTFDLPLSKLKGSIPGFTILSLESPDQSGFLRVGLNRLADLQPPPKAPTSPGGTQPEERPPLPSSGVPSGSAPTGVPRR